MKEAADTLCENWYGEGDDKGVFDEFGGVWEFFGGSLNVCVDSVTELPEAHFKILQQYEI